MASCKDCIHYEACDVSSVYFGYTVGSEKFREYEKRPDVERYCGQFKDRNRFVELPCKVGDTVYQTDGIRIYENKIERIIFDTNNIGFDETSIGKSIFLTREEAEQALKESEKC